MDTYIFAYGSLMNPRSLARTLPGERFMIPAILSGYVRKTNMPFDGYAYLNIVPHSGGCVDGILIRISQDELAMFDKREEGYARVDVTAHLETPIDGRAIAFIAPDIDYPGLQVPRSYLDTCLSGVPVKKRSKWLSETIMPHGTYEDTNNPVYEFVAE